MAAEQLNNHAMWKPRLFGGGNSGGETPGPIPNPEAKPTSADGTALEGVWESRTPPPAIQLRGPILGSGLFFNARTLSIFKADDGTSPHAGEDN